MGTPELAGASLEALLRAKEFQVVAVVTQPDQPKGRGLKLQPPPVKEIALRENLPVLQPERARDEIFLQQLRELQPDLIAVAAYGQILPPGILDLPRFGCLNVHTSLLPRYRGAAPIQRAILNGEAETGVTIMKMDAGLDTGGMLAQEKTPIHPADNSQTLHDHLAQIGADLLVRTIPNYVAGTIQSRPQPAEGVTHAAKIKKSDGQIDWNQPARTSWNRVRAMTPWPGAFAFLFGVPPSGGKTGRATPPEGGTPNQPPVLLKIWEAEVAPQSGTPGKISRADKNGIVVGCGSESLRVLIVQREGGRRMTAQEFLAGHPLTAGQKLG
jgi:methionyl-tRNA formyltransferase